MPSRCVVLGGDVAQLIVAGELVRTGHHVVLWHAPPATGPREAGVEEPRVTQDEAGIEGEAIFAGVTSDTFGALSAADLLIGRASPQGLSEVADHVLPLIEPRHTLVLLGGGMHVLAAAKWLGDRGRRVGATLVASDTMPLAERFAHERLDSAAPLAVHAGFGVFPALRTEATMVSLLDLFPTAKAHANVLAAALSTIEPLLSAVLLFMNLGAVERSCSGCLPFGDGFTPGIARVAETLDRERLAIAAALGLDLAKAVDALHAWGVSPLGDLWAAVNGSRVLRQSLGTGASCARRLAADAALWLRPWAELAAQLDVPAPLTESLAELCKVAVGAVSRDVGWSLDDLGISGMSGEALQRFLMSGGPAD